MKSTFKYLLIFVLFFAFLLRFWQLGEIPKGVTNDEASYIYSAYSIWETGKDIEGKFLPFSFTLDNSFSPVPIYLNSPVVGLLGLTPFTGRLIFTLAGFLSVVLIYLITRKLLKNDYIALCSCFVMAVSPWHLHFSRSAYDGVLALFFFLLATFLFLQNSRGVILSIFAFFLAFFSYHATKFFFILYIPCLIYLKSEYFIKNKKILYIFIGGCLGIILLFILTYITQGVTRDKVLLFSDQNKAFEFVNYERKTSTATAPFIKEIFNNKPLYYLRIVRENYLEAFSPQYLFLYGETSGLANIYGTSFRGVMYTIELPLLLIGLLFIFTKLNRKQKIFIICSLLIAPFPSAITSDKSYGMRSIMMIPFLSIIVGCGLYSACSWISQRKKYFKLILFFSFIIFYMFFIASYLYQYYSRYSLYGYEGWFGYSKELTKLLSENQSKFKNIYLVNNGDLIIQMAVYNQLSPQEVRRFYSSQENRKIENITFLNGCIDTHGEKFDPKVYLPPDTLYIVPELCHSNSVVSPVMTITDKIENQRIFWKAYTSN